jgi:hypothetical protein
VNETAGFVKRWATPLISSAAFDSIPIFQKGEHLFIVEGVSPGPYSGQNLPAGSEFLKLLVQIDRTEVSERAVRSEVFESLPQFADDFAIHGVRLFRHQPIPLSRFN